MFESVFTLLEFFNSTKIIYGRKKLQKVIHILENCGHQFPFKYEYHFYGPYSSQLQEEVNNLVRQGFLSEDRDDDTYIYRITTKGEEFKKQLEEGIGYNFSVDKAKLDVLIGKESQYLEVVSTYMFLLDSGYTSVTAKEKTRELKPHLAKYLNDAVSFTKQLLVH